MSVSNLFNNESQTYQDTQSRALMLQRADPVVSTREMQPLNSTKDSTNFVFRADDILQQRVRDSKRLPSRYAGIRKQKSIGRKRNPTRKACLRCCLDKKRVCLSSSVLLWVTVNGGSVSGQLTNRSVTDVLHSTNITRSAATCNPSKYVSSVLPLTQPFSSPNWDWTIISWAG